jgi:hypothetical protein
MVVIKGEFTFRVQFIQLPVQVGAYSHAIVWHKCAEQIARSSPLIKGAGHRKDQRFSVKLIEKKIEQVP